MRIDGAGQFFALTLPRLTPVTLKVCYGKVTSKNCLVIIIRHYWNSKRYFSYDYSFFDIVTQFSMNAEKITTEHHFYQFQQQIKVITFYQIYRWTRRWVSTPDAKCSILDILYWRSRDTGHVMINYSKSNVMQEAQLVQRHK